MCMTAVRGVDPDLINLARSFKASRSQIFWKIEFPASMPPLFAGLRIGSTLAVVGVVVGELVGGNSGLGYLLSFGEGQGNTAMVFVSIIMLTLVGGIAYLAGDPARAARAALHAQARDGRDLDRPNVPRLDKSWTVFRSIENDDHDRCVDLFERPDRTFGFEEFRRDVEDAGMWTPVRLFRPLLRHIDAALAAALKTVIWLTPR